MQKPFVIAIAAVSGGGKTTVTKLLGERLSHTKALYFDDYDFNSEPDDLCEWIEQGADPGEWDLTPLIQDVERLVKQRPSLDFIILDYPFAYSQKEMNPYIDCTIFIDTPLDIAMARRISRDFTSGSIEDVREEITIYLNRARFAFLHMLQTVKPDSDFIVDGSLPVDIIVELIKAETMNRREISQLEISKANLRTCKNGHPYYKSSDCLVCPVCEQERKPKEGLLSLLSAPARRALENNGITTLQELSGYSEKEILNFHGMGPSSIPKLKSALEEQGLSFKK